MPPSRTSSIVPIISCLSANPSLDTLQALDDADWESVVVTAIALGLAPLLHDRLTRLNLPLPPMAMAKLAVTRQAHAQRNGCIGQQLAELLQALAAQQIPSMVLKGALLAPTAYDDAALRPMNDIDLLFRPADLASVAPVLESLGYVGKHKNADEGPGVTKHLSTYRRVGNDGPTPNPYLSAGGDRMIEPHGSLEESWFGLKVDITPGFWERAIPLKLHGQPAFRLSTNDLLLHLAVHATYHVIMGSSVFLQLYDIRQVVVTWPDQIDWTQLLSLARAARAQPFLLAGLYWTRSLYQASISERPILELKKECSPELVNYIQSLDAAGIFNRTQQPPLVTLGQRLRRGLSDRQETARWAGSLGGKWKVWQTALAVHKTDTANLLHDKLKALT
jgi:hypothetical protein